MSTGTRPEINDSALTLRTSACFPSACLSVMELYECSLYECYGQLSVKICG